MWGYRRFLSKMCLDWLPTFASDSGDTILIVGIGWEVGWRGDGSAISGSSMPSRSCARTSAENLNKGLGFRVGIIFRVEFSSCRF